MSRKNSKELISRKYDRRGFFAEIWRRMRTNPGAVFGLVVLVLILLTTLYGIVFISYEQVTALDPLNRLKHPSAAHIFGTDEMGRDMFLRVIYGLRYSLSIAIGAVALAAVVGTFMGALAGYYGGTVDTAIMRTTDILSSIPAILLGMVVVSVLGNSLINLMLAIGLTAVPLFVRMSRASVLTVRGNEYIEAAQAIGMSSIRIIITQVIPNAISPIIVAFTSRIGTAILEVASLSFVGFGVRVPLPELGSLISGGRNFINKALYITLFPGLFIMLTTFSFAQLGDGLRDALDPRLKK
ncbi:MAG: ABC transporter permease [Bacillota bacterium]